MSYILDALKKSEKERQQTAAPDLKTFQDALPYVPKKKAVWPYLIAGIILLNAIILTLWLLPSNPKKEKPSKQSVALTQMEGDDSEKTKMDKSEATTVTIDKNIIQTPIADKKLINEPQGIQQEKKVQPKAEADKRDSDKIIKRADTREEQEHSLPSSPNAPSPSLTGHEPQAEQKIPAPVPNKIYSPGDLPLSIQQVLPSFSVSAFLYSDDPGSRMVRINGKMLREGSYFAEGLKLDEITSGSLIFSYQNYRFRVDIK